MLKKYLLAGALLCLAVPVFAALGDTETTVASDAAKMKAALRTTRKATYTLHEIQTPAGTSVREFVSPQGKVFAVAWQGQSRPDLQQVLGSYYEKFLSMVPARRAHGPVTIQSDDQDFVVQSGGHMRALWGRAYIRSMVPSDVPTEEIH